jgi:hypothetical protein
MATIAHITERIVHTKPYLEEALAKGIVNYASLAEQLMPEIENQFGRKVNEPAVIMALRRYQEKLDKSFVGMKVERKAEVNVISNMEEMTVERNAVNLKKAREMQKSIGSDEKFFLTLGTHEITIIAASRHDARLKKMFRRSKVLKDLAALVVQFDTKFQSTPGFYYLILRELAWENINVVEFVSTKTELDIMVHDRDVGRAYDVLTWLFKG